MLRPDQIQKLAVLFSLVLLMSCHRLPAGEGEPVERPPAENIVPPASREKPTSAFELVEQLGLGWNLGNSLDAMHKERGFTIDTEGFWGNPKTTEQLIEAVKAAGFRSIRIPISYYNHLDENGNIDPAWLDRVEHVVGWALDNSLYTVINIHHDTGMDPSLYWIYADAEAFDRSKEDFTNLWTQIAARFSDYDERLIFQSSGEWMNKERNWDAEKSMEDFRTVHELNQAFIDTVRSSGGKNSARYLMLSPFSASAEEEIVRAMFYKPFVDPAKDRLILSVHSYTEDTDSIESGAAALHRISQDYNIPIVLDEFGIPNFMEDPRKTEILKLYAREAEKHGIACFFWDDGYEYILIDRSTAAVRDPGFLEEVLAITNGGD